MEDKWFRRIVAAFAVLLLISPLAYHLFYNHTRKDRVIDEINTDFKIAYFYPDAMLAHTEGGGADGKDKISVMDYAHMNQDGVHRLENQSNEAKPENLKLADYLARFQGREGYDEVKDWMDQLTTVRTEYRTVERNGRQMILIFNRAEKNAVLFNCKIDN